MHMPTLRQAIFAAALTSVALVPGTAFAETLSLWARASSSTAAQHMIDLWNTSHEDKIELTTIPDNQMVTKLATSVQAGDVPDTEADVSELIAQVGYRPTVSVEQGVANFVAWYRGYYGS